MVCDSCVIDSTPTEQFFSVFNIAQYPNLSSILYFYVPGQKKKRMSLSNPPPRSHLVFPPLPLSWSPLLLYPPESRGVLHRRASAPRRAVDSTQLAWARERREQRGEGETCRRCNYHPLSCQLRAAWGRVTPAKRRWGEERNENGRRRLKGAARGVTPRASSEIERKMSLIGREFRRKEKTNKGEYRCDWALMKRTRWGDVVTGAELLFHLANKNIKQKHIKTQAADAKECVLFWKGGVNESNGWNDHLFDTLPLAPCTAVNQSPLSLLWFGNSKVTPLDYLMHLPVSTSTLWSQFATYTSNILHIHSCANESPL